jgi:hypothetical protein
VHLAADAVADERADDGVARCLRRLLHRVAMLREVIARARLLDAAPRAPPARLRAAAAPRPRSRRPGT